MGSQLKIPKGTPPDVAARLEALFASADLLDGRGGECAPPPHLSEALRYTIATHLRSVVLESEQLIVPAAIAGEKRELPA